MLPNKFKWGLFLLLALLLANTVHAELDDLNLLHQKTDTPDSMVWPMLPDESLTQLAAKFYPNNKGMQRKFILKTKGLNTAKRSANAPYKKLTAITVPNLKTLSVEAGTIKRAKKNLRLSLNIKPKKEKLVFSLKSIPERLTRQYEELLTRNEFLKVELAKLGQRLVFLEDKLGQLKLVMDRTLSFPTQRKLKNLDAEPGLVKNAQAKPMVELTTPSKGKTATKNKAQQTGVLGVSNKLLWISLALLSTLMLAGTHLIGKYRKKEKPVMADVISRPNTETEDPPAAEQILPEYASLNTDTVVEEQADQNVIEEAKDMVVKGRIDGAIDHLKWAIRANPKSSINAWLYLLEIFKQQDLRQNYETFASEMHEHFNVMTPLWEKVEADVVVPQSLEEFPHIIEYLISAWPEERAVDYLEQLISDNRSGNRSGFSMAVIEEVLTLIRVLEICQSEGSV